MREIRETTDPTPVETSDAPAPVSPPRESIAPAMPSEPWESVAPPGESMPAALPTEPWHKVRELARRQLDRFISLEPKVLSGDDPDAIHDMRVASRRLQQVLDLLYPAPWAPEVRRLRRKIRRCRRALGEVRNCDVLLSRVAKSLGRKRASHRKGWEAVQQYLLKRRAKSFGKAARKLGKLKIAVFYVRLKGWLSAGGEAPRPGHHHSVALVASQAGQAFHHRVTQDLGRFWDAFETQVAQSHQNPRPAVIHAVRIAAKRLRYLIEVIHAFEVPGSADAVALLRAVQQHLGDWHDLEVLERMMIEMIARPDFLRDQLELAITVEKLILGIRSIKKSFVEKYFRMSRGSPEFGRIREWVAYLLSSPPAALITG